MRIATYALTAALLLLSTSAARAQSPATTGSTAASRPVPAPAADAPSAPDAPSVPATPAMQTERQAASAQASAPPTERVVPPISAALVSARRLLQSTAEQERSVRAASSYSMVISGATLIATGLLAENAYHQSYGKPLWIAGIVLGVGALANLFAPGPFARLAHEAQWLNAEDLQRAWEKEALAARRSRVIGGVVSLSLGAISLGAGAAIGAGLGDMSPGPKEDWTIALLSVGGALAASSVASFLVKSLMESSYHAAYGADPGESSPIAFDVMTTARGAALGMHASF